jgi:hypothetical protein
MRVRTTTKLVSTDNHSNTANVKHTIACDLVPLCRDDLVAIHRSAKKAKLAGRLALVARVAPGSIQLVDAAPKRRNAMIDSQMELSADTYYRNEKHYKLLQAAHRMTRFVALDVEPCSDSVKTTATTTKAEGGSRELLEPTNELQQPQTGGAAGSERLALADVQVARESDFGVNDETFSAVTHMGHLLSSGDGVAGYDLAATVGGDWELDDILHGNYVLPDVVLVKKVAGDVAATEVDDVGGASSSSRNHEPPTKTKNKKKEKRQKNRDKRRRDLEERAVRMGFLHNDDDDNVDNNTHTNDAAFDAELMANDPELAAEVMALERDFDALGGVSSASS